MSREDVAKQALEVEGALALLLSRAQPFLWPDDERALKAAKDVARRLAEMRS